MATTAQGTTYVESSDLVSAYPTASLAVANAIDTKATLAMTQNPQTGTSYTAALTDAYKLVTMSNAAANTFTVPPQSSVTWVTGQQLRVLNSGAGTCTITPGSGVTINGTPLTLAQHKGGTLIRTASDTWTFIPFQGGASAPVVDEGASTGVTFSTLTDPDGDGKNYRLAACTANATLVVTTAGVGRILVVGGGGAGGSAIGSTWGAGGGGAGGVLAIATAWLPSGSLSITVGAGGTGSATALNVLPGGSSSIGGLYSAAGGGNGSCGNLFPSAAPGGSGGGYHHTNRAASPGVVGQGNAGGLGDSSGGGGGGGGGGAVGTNGAGGAVGGAGGVGTASTITGSSVTYGGGGGGAGGTSSGAGGTGGGGAGSTAGAGTAGTANRGGGGGGAYAVAQASGSGGSGVVYARWEI